MRHLALVIPLFAAIEAASAQTPATQPADRPLPSFEVASVKRNVAGVRVPISISSPPGRFTATNVPLWMLITAAYDLRSYQYIGIPDWGDRFDVVAKAPDGAAQDQTLVRKYVGGT